MKGKSPYTNAYETHKEKTPHEDIYLYKECEITTMGVGAFESPISALTCDYTCVFNHSVTWTLYAYVSKS